MEVIFTDLEFKAGDAGLITGYLAVTGNVDRQGDKIEPGAFKGISGPIPMLREHEASAVIGVWNTVVEKPKGLWGEGQIDMEDPMSARAHGQAKRGLVKGISIGYQSDRKTNLYNIEDGTRVIKKILNVFEASLVVIPANPKAMIDKVKSMDGLITPRALERFLKSKGMNAVEAKRMVGEFKQFVQGEEPDGDAGSERDAATETEKALALEAGEFNDMLKSFAIQREADDFAGSLANFNK